MGARRFLGVAGTLAVLWLGGLAWYVASMPDAVEDPDTPTDAIVVLTGGSERVRTGLDLLRRGRGRVLLVSGVHAGTTLDALLADATAGAAPLPASLRAAIDLGYAAADTIGNADETARWMRERHMVSLRLVTAAYHMPRSLLELSAALPEARIIPHPVFPERVMQSNWWSYPGTASLFASEYHKYLAARARLLLHQTGVVPLPHSGKGQP